MISIKLVEQNKLGIITVQGQDFSIAGDNPTSEEATKIKNYFSSRSASSQSPSRLTSGSSGAPSIIPAVAQTAIGPLGSIVGSGSSGLEDIAKAAYAGLKTTGRNVAGLLPDAAQQRLQQAGLIQPLGTDYLKQEEGRDPTTAESIVKSLAQYAPYLAGGEAALGTRLGEGLTGAATRGAAEMGVQGAVEAKPGTGSRALGAGIGAAVGAVAPAVGQIVASPVRTAAGGLVSRMGRAAAETTPAGSVRMGLGNIPRMQPEQLQALLSSGTPLSGVGLPELTGTAGKALTALSAATNKQGMKDAVADSISQKNDILANIFGKDSGDTVSQDDMTNTNAPPILNLKSAHNDAWENMSKDYKSLQQEAGNQPFTTRTNLINSIDKHTNPDLDPTNTGDLPNFNSEENSFLSRIQQGEPASFEQFKKLESILKRRARDAGATNQSPKMDAFNDMADSVRQDISDNLEQMGSNLPNFKGKIEAVNKAAKQNYYDIWNKKNIQNLLSEKSTQTAGSLLGDDNNQNLMNTLDQPTKNSLIADKLSQTMKGGDISPTQLVSNLTSGKQGSGMMFNNLDPETQQKVINLDNLNKITSRQRNLDANVPTGVMLRGLLKGKAGVLSGLTGVTGLGVGLATNPVLTAGLTGLGGLTALGARKVLKETASPEALEAYANRTSMNPSQVALLARTIAKPAVSPISRSITNKDGN